MSLASRLVTKLSKLRCLVYSIWHTFFSSLFTVSMIVRFLRISLSCRFISEFFMFFLILVTRCRSSTNSISKSSWLMYPLSANSFPKSLCVNRLFLSGVLSSMYLPLAAHPFMVLCMCMRLIWQDTSDVESMMDMPVHLPRAHVCRNSRR